MNDFLIQDTEDLPLNEPFYLIVAWGGQGSDDEASITKHTSREIFSTMISFGTFRYWLITIVLKHYRFLIVTYYNHDDVDQMITRSFFW